MWECGLKHSLYGLKGTNREVTPYVGVWIETAMYKLIIAKIGVTPYVGVWIETYG